MFMDAAADNAEPVTVEYQHALSGPQNEGIETWADASTLNAVVSQALEAHRTELGVKYEARTYRQNDEPGSCEACDPSRSLMIWAHGIWWAVPTSGHTTTKTSRSPGALATRSHGDKRHRTSVKFEGIYYKDGQQIEGKTNTVEIDHRVGWSRKIDNRLSGKSRHRR